MYRHSSSEFASMNVVDHVDEVTVFLVSLNAWVVDVGGGAEVIDLSFAILICNNTALLCGERQKLAFLSSRESLQVRNTALHL